MNNEFLEAFRDGDKMYINLSVVKALGINAGLVYHSLLAKQYYYEQRGMLDEEGYFYSTVEDMERTTTLTRSQQGRAVAALVEAGLIDYYKGGVFRRRHFRVRTDEKLLDKFFSGSSNKSSSCKKQENNSEPAEAAEAVQDIFSENCKQESEEIEDKFSEKVGSTSSVSSEYPAKNSRSTPKESSAPIYINNNKKIREVNNNQSIIHIKKNESDRIDGIESSQREKYLELIREKLKYDLIPRAKRERIDEIIEIMLDVICTKKDIIRVNGNDVPAEVVKSRFLKLEYEHIEYIYRAMRECCPNVRNIRSYLITALYNAPATLYNHTAAEVYYDGRAAR